MPELPEVETVVRDLRPLLVGTMITHVEKDEQELRKPWDKTWETTLLKKKVREVSRRGKWILVRLTHKFILVYHLGMTGQLTIVNANEPRRNHTHLILQLRPKNQELRFRDIRRFGSATLFDSPESLAQFFENSALGPEPFDIAPTHWQSQLESTERCVKAVLLDQRVVAGIGNIYADEILFEARVHPSRVACDLSQHERERVRISIPQVLTRAIEHRGSSIRNYIGGSGLRGGYQDEFLAYGREGLPCARCKTLLLRKKIAGRTSCYCPQCQPLKQG